MAKPIYQFSSLKSNSAVFAVFLVFDVFWIAQYVVFGAPVLLGGRLGSYLSQPVEMLLLDIFLIAGTAITAVVTTRSSKIEFFDNYFRICHVRNRTSEEIPYDQVTRVDVIQLDLRGSYSFRVAFQIVGRSKPYDVPKSFPGGGLITKESSGARDFANWVRSRAKLPTK